MLFFDKLNAAPFPRKHVALPAKSEVLALFYRMDTAGPAGATSWQRSAHGSLYVTSYKAPASIRETPMR
jgi:hypothetical protein